MNIVEIIEKKRDGKTLSEEEIRFFVSGVNDGSLPDYQISALLMAIYINKMNDRETAVLTDAMAKSGDIVDLSYIDGIKVDKHSSGGIGDKTTLAVAPMVAACGLSIAKMSGRGLGYSGGTIDKLESIPGFRTTLSEEEFISFVKRDRIAVMGQSKNIAPADKKLYALRDVTGTVPDMSLIASSIMSKKLACNSDAIVLDVKAGSGAFMKTVSDAVELAEKMVSIGIANGKRMTAAITCMDQPLGYAVGNALEVKEAIATLKGSAPPDFLELCLVIGSFLLILGEKAENEAAARKMLLETISSGSALASFRQFVKNQGGDLDYIDNLEKLPTAKYILPVRAEKDGFINSICGETIGRAAIAVNAGRLEKSDAIDHASGIVFVKKVGDSVEAGEITAFVHASDEKKGKTACEMVRSALMVSDCAEKLPVLYAYVDKEGIHYV